MIWFIPLVVCIAFIALFFILPKETALAAGVVVLAFAAVTAFVFYDDAQSRAARAAMVEAVKLEARYDPQGCSPDRPIKVTLLNQNTQSILSIDFGLAGYRPGHSAPIFNSVSDSLSTDRILRQNEPYDLCVAVPRLSSDALQSGLTPDQFSLDELEWRTTHQSLGLKFE